MKIAFFHNLPGGGSVTVLKNWYEALSKRDHVDIYSVTDPKSKKWIKSIFPHNKQITKFVKPWSGFLLYNIWVILRLRDHHKNLAEEINNKNYDLVIVHHDYFTKSPYLLRYLNAKKIYVLHEPPREFYEQDAHHTTSFRQKIANYFRRYLKIIDRHNSIAADYIVSNSMYSAGIIKKVYARDSIVIYPWISSDFDNAKRAKKKNTILSIGGLSVTKGHDFVIESLIDLLDEYSLIIIGDGSKEDLKRLRSKTPKGADVKFITKHISTPALVEIISSAKLLCVGSYNEPFGLTSIEAQACSTPVLCVDEGGLPETIKGHSGLLSRRNGSDYLKKAKKILTQNTPYALGAKVSAKKYWTKKVLSQKLVKLIDLLK